MVRHPLDSCAASFPVLVSFLWGVLAFGQQLRSVGGSIVSLALLLLFIFGIASCKPDAESSEPIKAQMIGEGCFFHASVFANTHAFVYAYIQV